MHVLLGVIGLALAACFIIYGVITGVHWIFSPHGLIFVGLLILFILYRRTKRAVAHRRPTVRR